jgi:hypothetical protein
MMNNYGTAPAQLRMRQGPFPGRSFPVSGEKTHIGRDLGNDIVIDDPEVSRRHACITHGPGGYSIEDLGSTNGTFVNGIRIVGSQALRDGDIIGLGQVIVAFEETVEVGGDTMSDITAAPPAAGRQASPPPAYAPPPPTAPTAPAERDSGALWFLVGCGCVVVAVLLVAIVIAVLAATGTISLGGIGL